MQDNQTIQEKIEKAYDEGDIELSLELAEAVEELEQTLEQE